LLGPAGFNPNHDTLDQALVVQFHDQGMTTAVWTVDDKGDMRRPAQWAVDAIITNKPGVCLPGVAGGREALAREPALGPTPPPPSSLAIVIVIRHPTRPRRGLERAVRSHSLRVVLQLKKNKTPATMRHKMRIMV